MKKNMSWKFTDESSISGSGEFGHVHVQLAFLFISQIGFWVKEKYPGFGYPIPDTFRYMGKSREVSIVIYCKV